MYAVQRCLRYKIRPRASYKKKSVTRFVHTSLDSSRDSRFIHVANWPNILVRSGTFDQVALQPLF